MRHLKNVPLKTVVDRFEIGVPRKYVLIERCNLFILYNARRNDITTTIRPGRAFGDLRSPACSDRAKSLLFIGTNALSVGEGNTSAYAREYQKQNNKLTCDRLLRPDGARICNYDRFLIFNDSVIKSADKVSAELRRPRIPSRRFRRILRACARSARRSSIVLVRVQRDQCEFYYYILLIYI